MARRSPEKHFSVQIKATGLGLLMIAGALFAASLIVGGVPMLRGAAIGFRTPIPYILALAATLFVVGHLLRPKVKSSIAPQAGARDPEFFPNIAPAPGERAQPDVPRAPATAPGRATAWTAQVFKDIEWKRFETLCAQLFSQAGFEAKTQSHGADGGVDIWLLSRNADGPVAVVQCKHWTDKPVRVKEMRELLGVMASHKLTRGTFATSGTFTKDALEFAQANKINALDGAGLLSQIAKRTPEQQEELLRHAYEGDYWRPSCASCGTKLVERTKRDGGTKFWGCPSFPRCNFTLPMRARA